MTVVLSEQNFFTKQANSQNRMFCKTVVFMGHDILIPIFIGTSCLDQSCANSK